MENQIQTTYKFKLPNRDIVKLSSIEDIYVIETSFYDVVKQSVFLLIKDPDFSDYYIYERIDNLSEKAFEEFGQNIREYIKGYAELHKNEQIFNLDSELTINYHYFTDISDNNLILALNNNNVSSLLVNNGYSTNLQGGLDGTLPMIGLNQDSVLSYENNISFLSINDSDYKASRTRKM